MTAVMGKSETDPQQAGRRYLIVSTDSHTGPSLAAMRQFCPKEYLGEYDAFDADAFQRSGAGSLVLPPEIEELWRVQNVDGGVNDAERRLENMDRDGVAAEVIFHGLGSPHLNGALMPFVNTYSEKIGDIQSAQLQRVGQHIYNQWLAEFCSAAPDRLIGVPEIPFWDIDAAVAEVKWAAEAGFKAVNFAAPRPNMPTYEDPVWEPFWSAVEDADVVLNCHSGARLHPFPAAGKAFSALFWSETHFVGHSPFAMMCFGGVFKRHERLRVIFNEQRGYWVWQQLRDLDGIHRSPWNRLLREDIDMCPSEYWRRHCFIGGSFLAHFELEHRDEIGIETITWARDYPHPEGTWPFTREALRAAFFDCDTDDVAKILGDNAVRCYKLDGRKLSEIAAAIGPAAADVREPLDATPEGAYSLAFRDRDDAPGGARFGSY
jgi:predicted TIM-barrel fold metal-dependent hydrolase